MGSGVTYWDLLLLLLGIATVAVAWWPDGLVSEIVAEVECYTREGLALLAGAVAFISLTMLGLAFIWWSTH